MCPHTRRYCSINYVTYCRYFLLVAYASYVQESTAGRRGWEDAQTTFARWVAGRSEIKYLLKTISLTD